MQVALAVGSTTGMRRQILLNEARDLLTLFITRIRGSTALRLTDINKISERFMVELFREVFDLPGLRDLNEEKDNFEGLDLADDGRGTAFQVTAETNLQKVKDTLQTVIEAGLHTKYPKIRIYVLTEKQASRAQKSINDITQGRLHFDIKKDVLDYRDVLRICGTLDLARLERVVSILKNHLEDRPAVAAPTYSSGLSSGLEPVELNLVPISFPDTVYLADCSGSPQSQVSRLARKRRAMSPRHNVVQDIMRRGLDAPEDFEIHGNRLITFHDPTAVDSALRTYIDAGTLTPLTSKEYFSVDLDHLGVFKSLLRRALQRQLRPDYIHWQHEERLFFFAPVKGLEKRSVVWKEGRQSERIVFQATMKTNKPDEVLTCKHLAFYVDFHNIASVWYMAIAPTWYFSTDGYRRDPFASKRISWLKRQENDQQVHTHFRFISNHLASMQERSLFDGPHPRTFIRIADSVRFRNHPYLPDHLWNPPGQRNSADPGQESLPI